MAARLGPPEKGAPIADLYLHVQELYARIDALMKLVVLVKDLQVTVSVYDSAGNFIANGSGTAVGRGHIEENSGGTTLIIAA